MAERATGDRARTQSLGWGRVTQWRSEPAVAHLCVNEGARPSRGNLARDLRGLRAAGYRSVVTSALGPAAALPFLDEGFAVRERLHLLERRLVASVHPLDGPELRRAWHADHGPVLELDARSFDPFWRLDATAMHEALVATPSVRFRVGDRADGSPAAYAITGRAGPTGYLQRVAVHPVERGRGWGRALVLDGLDWLHRRGAARALVNTQWENHAALQLYLSCGFERLPAGLSVLERPL